MTVLFLSDQLLTDHERNVVEAALRLEGHRSVRSWAQAEGLSYDTAQKVISQQRPAGHLAEALSEVVVSAGLEGRVQGSGQGGGKSARPA